MIQGNIKLLVVFIDGVFTLKIEMLGNSTAQETG
jgi:hypothetical protein